MLANNDWWLIDHSAPSSNIVMVIYRALFGALHPLLLQPRYFLSLVIANLSSDCDV